MKPLHHDNECVPQLLFCVFSDDCAQCCKVVFSSSRSKTSKLLAQPDISLSAVATTGIK